LGLDHYEVTKYRGWHHHATLAMLALAFLKSVQRRWRENGISASVPEIRQLLEVVLPRVRWTPALAIAWWRHQQLRKIVARNCHWTSSARGPVPALERRHLSPFQGGELGRASLL
jgi:hypothetical protein